MMSGNKRSKCTRRLWLYQYFQVAAPLSKASNIKIYANR